MSSKTLDTQADGITRVSAQQLIQLRHLATKLPLNKSKIHAKQGGAYLSSFKGRGMEYDESRIYLPGDDIRNMDWRVTARSGKAHTKIFQEERERPVLLWLDLNDSMFFATRGVFKSVLASKLAAILGWSTASQNDRLGALVFSGDDHTEIRPARGKSAVLNFIGQTCKHKAWQQDKKNKRNMMQAMLRLRQVTRPGSLMFLISDFFEHDGSSLSEQTCAHLINLSRHNDIVLIQMYDPIEASLPDSGIYNVSDGDNEILVDANSKATRENYNQRFAEHQNALRDLCRRHRMHLIPVSTNEDPLTALQNGMGIHHTHGSQFKLK